MISKQLTTRIFTSIPLIFLLVASFYYSFILATSLVIISSISWIEFNELIFKIFKKNKINSKFKKLLIRLLSLIYLIIFSMLVYVGFTHESFKYLILYLFLICICSDIGGLIFGKIFKGKKLTKISPNKTISGSIGSFILSLTLVPIFYLVTNLKSVDLQDLILVAILVSFFCQAGDLFISLLKRNANVKDTGNILPGHGGLLDRIDGMLFAIPMGVFILKILIENL